MDTRIMKKNPFVEKRGERRSFDRSFTPKAIEIVVLSRKFNNVKFSQFDSLIIKLTRFKLI